MSALAYAKKYYTPLQSPARSYADIISRLNCDPVLSSHESYRLLPHGHARHPLYIARPHEIVIVSCFLVRREWLPSFMVTCRSEILVSLRHPGGISARASCKGQAMRLLLHPPCSYLRFSLLQETSVLQYVPFGQAHCMFGDFFSNAVSNSLCTCSAPISYPLVFDHHLCLTC